MIARIRCPRPWASVRPTKAPRASGSACGVRSPERYGRKKSPSLPGRHLRRFGREDFIRIVAPFSPFLGRGHVGLAKPIAEPLQRAAAAEVHAHHVPLAAHGMAEGVQPAQRIDFDLVAMHEHHARGADRRGERRPCRRCRCRPLRPRNRRPRRPRRNRCDSPNSAAAAASIGRSLPPIHNTRPKRLTIELELRQQSASTSAAPPRPTATCRWRR